MPLSAFPLYSEYGTGWKKAGVPPSPRDGAGSEVQQLLGHEKPQTIFNLAAVIEMRPEAWLTEPVGTGGLMLTEGAFQQPEWINMVIYWAFHGDIMILFGNYGVHHWDHRYGMILGLALEQFMGRLQLLGSRASLWRSLRRPWLRWIQRQWSFYWRRSHVYLGDLKLFCHILCCGQRFLIYSWIFVHFLGVSSRTMGIQPANISELWMFFPLPARLWLLDDLMAVCSFPPPPPLLHNLVPLQQTRSLSRAHPARTLSWATRDRALSVSSRTFLGPPHLNTEYLFLSQRVGIFQIEYQNICQMKCHMSDKL